MKQGRIEHPIAKPALRRASDSGGPRPENRTSAWMRVCLTLALLIGAASVQAATQLKTAVVMYNFPDFRPGADTSTMNADRLDAFNQLQQITRSQMEAMVFRGQGYGYATTSTGFWLEDVTEGEYELVGARGPDPEIYDWVTLPVSAWQNRGGNPDHLNICGEDRFPQIDQAAEAATLDPRRFIAGGPFRRADYDVVVYAGNFPGCTDSYKGNGNIFSRATDRRNWEALAHEFGHYLGLDHANLLHCFDSFNNPVRYPGDRCISSEYDDATSIMGWTGWAGHFSAFEKLRLGVWDVGTEILQGAAPSPGTTVYRLNSQTSATNPRALRIPLGAISPELRRQDNTAAPMYQGVDAIDASLYIELRTSEGFNTHTFRLTGRPAPELYVRLAGSPANYQPAYGLEGDKSRPGFEPWPRVAGRLPSYPGYWIGWRQIGPDTAEVFISSNDRDGDGLPDTNDNCVATPNPDQADSDMDGYGDACDLCPDVYGSGAWDNIDSDGDGVANACDFCPYQADAQPLPFTPGSVPRSVLEYEDAGGESFDLWCTYSPNTPVCDASAAAPGDDNCACRDNPSQSDLDGDGVGDRCDEDMDNDGIPNEEDNCPTVWNSNQSNIDWDAFGDACDCDPSDPGRGFVTDCLFDDDLAARYQYLRDRMGAFARALDEIGVDPWFGPWEILFVDDAPDVALPEEVPDRIGLNQFAALVFDEEIGLTAEETLEAVERLVQDLRSDWFRGQVDAPPGGKY